MPSAVQENKRERPYFPRIFIIVDKKSGQVLDFETYESIDEDGNVTLNKLINMCLGSGVPIEIQVRSEKMVAILEDFCKKTGIKLKFVKGLPYIDHMLEEMAYSF